MIVLMDKTQTQHVALRRSQENISVYHQGQIAALVIVEQGREEARRQCHSLPSSLCGPGHLRTQHLAERQLSVATHSQRHSSIADHGVWPGDHPLVPQVS